GRARSGQSVLARESSRGCLLFSYRGHARLPSARRSGGASRKRVKVMDSNSIDLRTFKVVASQDIELAAKQGMKTVVIRKGAVITPSARDFATSRGITLTVDGASVDGNSHPAARHNKSHWDALLNSPEANKIKDEIIAVGKKLWQRQYVD